jgi:hypothetical protein
MKITKIAFPQEHGSWGFFLEPLFLSLAVAYSSHGAIIALSAFFIFLAHQPVRLFLDKKTERKNKKIALLFIFGYLIVIVLSLWEVSEIVSFGTMIPYIIALTLMGGVLIFELVTEKEDFLARLIPPLAVDFIAITIVLADGWGLPKAEAFYLVLFSRSLTTALYIHEKLKKMRKQEINRLIVYTTHVLFMIALAYTSSKGLTPYLSIFAVVVMLVRALSGLETKKKTNVKKVGLWEFSHGLIFVIINAIGYLMNW